MYYIIRIQLYLTLHRLQYKHALQYTHSIIFNRLQYTHSIIFNAP